MIYSSVVALPLGVEYIVVGTVLVILAAALLGALRFRLFARVTAIVLGASFLLFVSDRLLAALTLWRTVVPLPRRSGPAPIVREWEHPGIFWFAVVLWSVYLILAFAVVWFAFRGDPSRVDRFRARLVRLWPITLVAATMMAWAGLSLLPKGWEFMQNPWLENAIPARRLLP